MGVRCYMFYNAKLFLYETGRGIFRPFEGEFVFFLLFLTFISMKDLFEEGNHFPYHGMLKCTFFMEKTISVP